MAEMDDRELDVLLERHFGRELDPHLGHARERWATDRANRRLRLRWTWGLVGAAAAAAVVAIALVHPLGRPRPGPDGAALPDGQLTIMPVTSATVSRTVDEDTIVTEDQTPVRVVRREILQTTEWFDPQHQARIQIERPGEQVLLIGLSKY